MQICVDIQSAIAQRAGVGRYTKRLVEHLAQFRGHDDLRLFYFDFKRKGEPFPVADAEFRACRWLPGRLAQVAWKHIGLPPFNWFAGRADLFHFPNFIRPPIAGGKSVVTIHDLAFLRHPETIESGNYRYLTDHIHNTVASADAIIAVSQFTAREIQDLLDVPANKIHAIQSGVEHFRHLPHETEIAATRKMLNLQRPYLLCLSTLEPRKNFPFLVDVFERLGHFDGDLVIAGGRGWKCAPILDRFKTSPRAPRIRYLEYVHDDLLPGLYAGAELFVFPSLYEGFGFTPLEAMARGTAVVSSAGGSLPEVLGEAAEVIPNFNADEWAAKIEALLGDTARLRRLKDEGLKQAQKFSWDDTARQTWAVYRGV